jgi:probable F420-dependent oxidoreductase
MVAAYLTLRQKRPYTMRASMHLGVTIFLTDRTIGPAELAREVEARGFHSLYVPEHTHMPVSRTTAPPTGGAELDEAYSRTLDPFVALTAAATVTARLVVGTGIALVAQHDPIALAKQVATLDHLSDGRFVLGIGFGWNREEMADHRVDYARRREIVREHMLLAQSLWSGDVGAFGGEFVSVAPSWAWPKPIQQPRVRTLIGGAPGPKLFAAIAEYADGWMPIGGAGVGKALPALRQACADAGRDPAAIDVVPFGTVPDAGKLDYYRSLGIHEVVLRLPPAAADAVLPVLDDFARYVE